jgi:hypothetical protein
MNCFLEIKRINDNTLTFKNELFNNSFELMNIDINDYKFIYNEQYNILKKYCKELKLINCSDKKNLLFDFNIELLDLINSYINFKDLYKLKDLKYLIIDDYFKNKKFEIPTINNLEYLELKNINSKSLNINYYKNLKSLKLQNIKVLNKLYINELLNLNYLSLINISNFYIPDTFINLKTLELENISLKELPNTLINLETLILIDCYNLYYLPETYINLKSLTLKSKKIKIKYIPDTYTNLNYLNLDNRYNFHYHNTDTIDEVKNFICIQIKKNINDKFINNKNNFLYLSYDMFYNLKTFIYNDNIFNIDNDYFKRLVDYNLYVNNNFLII